MTGHRATAAIATLFVAAAWAAAPAAAAGGPLLSGYGGPGEGEQAILGSALLGGPTGSGGADGGSAGAGGPAGGEAGAGLAATSTTAVSTGGGSPRRVSAAPRDRARHAQTAGATASSRSGSAARAGSAPTASLRSASGSQALGLSGVDVVYILLALGALVLVGALTGQLARRSP